MCWHCENAHTSSRHQRIIYCVMMAANAAEYNTPLDDETAASWRTTWPLLHCPSCAATQSNHKSDVLMQDTNQSSAGCGPLSCYLCGWEQENLSALFRRQQLCKSCQQFKATSQQGWTNMTPAAIFFVGHSLKGLSGCWAVLKRKSVTFVSSCQSSTILGRLTKSRSTFNTLWLTQNGMYCITRTVVGLCVPPVSQVRATKKVGIRKASPWSLLYFCLSYYNLALIFSVDLLWRDHIIV